MPYIGTQPNDVKKNTGIYSPSEILRLTKEGSWGGSLELIAQQSADNSAQTLDFTDCFTDRFDVYKIQFKNYAPTNDENTLRLRLKNASGEISGASAYQFAIQYGNAGGSFGENKDTTSDYMQIMGGIGTSTGENASGYIYIYNPTNSSKYTFASNQSTFLDQNGNYTMFFGGSVYTTAESVTGCIFRNISAGGTLGNINTCDISIYGVKQI